MSGLTDWKSVQKFQPKQTPAVLTDNSTSVFDKDPDIEKARSALELVNILSGLLPGKMGASAIGGLGIIKKAGGSWNPKNMANIRDGLLPWHGVDDNGLEALYRGLKQNPQAMETTWQNMLRNNDPALEDFRRLMAFDKDPTVVTLNQIVDTRFMPYIKNRMGAETDDIRLMLEKFPEKKAQLIATKQKQIDNVQAKLDKAQAERGVPEEYLTATNERMNKLRQEMEELNALSAPDVSLPRDWWTTSYKDALAQKRTRAGMPEEEIATSPEAKSWEKTIDKEITRTPRLITDPRTVGVGELKMIKETEHAINGSSKVNGYFQHMMDELKNSMRPDTDLPERLRLTTEKAKNMSMPQYVEHVEAVNAYRAALKAELDRGIANNPAMHTFMEFPENNPKGFSWKEFKVPPPKQQDIPLEKFEEHYASLPRGERDVWAEQWRQQRDDIAGNLSGKKALKDALSYEGDHMVNCVGGYCDDVSSGRTRILSLRDATGKPHATVELKSYNPEDVAYNHDFWGRPDVVEATKGLDPTSDEFNAVVDAIAKKDKPLAVHQIKGPKNSTKYDPEILPYIQQLLKKNNWPVEADFSGTKLFDVGAFEKNPSWSHPFPTQDATEWQTIIGDQSPGDILKKIRSVYPEDRFLTHKEFRDVFGLPND